MTDARLIEGLDRSRRTSGDEGSRTTAFEAAIAARLGARHAVAVGSPTVAFLLAYRAADLPAGSTLVATSLADPTVVRAAVASGYRLRFVDVDERGHVSAADLAAHVATHGAPALIVPSHHCGYVCDTAAIAALVPEAIVVEDATDALGARAADGRAIGSPAHAAMTIVGIQPVRASAPAQGAVVLTDDDAVAGRLLRLRAERAEHRLSELHAALALIQLGRLDGLVELRARIAARYDDALAAWPLASAVAPAADTRSAWWSYLVRVPAWMRAEMGEELRSLGIGGRRVAMLLHRHPYFRRCADALPAELPGTERFAAETLVLPTSPELGDERVLRVIDTLGAVATIESAGAAVVG
jgi:dTDP-4-amino-4,6-dideoxygalactose transaminase